MRKKLAAALAVMVVASACLTACSKTDTDAATTETATAETATGETAAIEYDLGLDDDGYFRNVTASKYIKMPKNYEKYTVSKDVYTVTDDAIRKELDAFQNNYNLTKEVTGRAAQSGDVVNIAYEGTVDGVAFTGGTSEDYNLQLGSGTFIEGFEDQIVGHNAGDSFDVTVTFPDGYGSTTDRTTGEQMAQQTNFAKNSTTSLLSSSVRTLSMSSLSSLRLPALAVYNMRHLPRNSWQKQTQINTNIRRVLSLTTLENALKINNGKAVLLSIKKEWLSKIMAGEKVMEVRKSMPWEISHPFVVFCYETKSNGGAGKVAAAFICDDIDSLNCLQSLAVFDDTELPKETEKFVNESCLTFKELFDYGKNVGALYGWHVASTQPLDKKLSDFRLKRPPQSWQYVRISI
mgnify:CR=1 FL=1